MRFADSLTFCRFERFIIYGEVHPTLLYKCKLQTTACNLR